MGHIRQKCIIHLREVKEISGLNLRTAIREEIKLLVLFLNIVPWHCKHFFFHLAISFFFYWQCRILLRLILIYCNSFKASLWTTGDHPVSPCHLCETVALTNVYTPFKHWCCVTACAPNTHDIWQVSADLLSPDNSSPHVVSALDLIGPIQLWIAKCGKTADTYKFYHQMSDICCSVWDRY